MLQPCSLTRRCHSKNKKTYKKNKQKDDYFKQLSLLTKDEATVMLEAELDLSKPDTDLIRRLIEYHPDLATLQGQKNQKTALHIGVEKEDEKLIDLLLNSDSPSLIINKRDATSSTPLFYANSAATVEKLIGKNAGPLIQNKSQVFAYSAVLNNIKDDDEKTTVKNIFLKNEIADNPYASTRWDNGLIHACMEENCPAALFTINLLRTFIERELKRLNSHHGKEDPKIKDLSCSAKEKYVLYHKLKQSIERDIVNIQVTQQIACQYINETALIAHHKRPNILTFFKEPTSWKNFKKEVGKTAAHNQVMVVSVDKPYQRGSTISKEINKVIHGKRSIKVPSNPLHPGHHSSEIELSSYNAYRQFKLRPKPQLKPCSSIPPATIIAPA